MKRIAPYGTWQSPITAADVASGQVPLAHALSAGEEVWWQEGRPDEGGRTAIMAAGRDGTVRQLVPPPFSARTRVHEYGGRSFLPVPGTSGGFGLVFANFADQRLYLRGGHGGHGGHGDGSAAPGTPLTPEPETPAGLRYADLVLSADGREIVCVRESHARAGGAITRAIVAVPLDGSAASDPAAVRVLVTGAGFFAFPAPSPDGQRLAWINWDHPRMPWDGTELRVGPSSGTTVADAALIMGGPRESVQAPAWRDDATLYVISDASGWWNLYLVEARPGAVPRPLCPREEEFAGPPWQLGGRPFGVLADGRLAVFHGLGDMRPALLDPASGTLTDLDLPFPTVQYGLAASGDTITAVAGGPATPWSAIRIKLSSPGGVTPRTPHRSTAPQVLRRGLVTAPDPAYLPVPRQVQLRVISNGPVVHALVYPPSSPAAEAPPGERPPYVVWIHGGPTAHVLPVLDLEKAYFTSRGIGVIDVNYGGSSGYGRAYRERLRGQWGVVDVADATSAALALADAGEADRARLGIRGGSAGGWTALAAVTSWLAGPDSREPAFSAAVSYYGVTDLKPFAAITHDFESRYLDGLVGPLPEAAAVYEERSPIGHVTARTCPILLLQGLDDPVVPPPQSESIVRDLAAHHIPHAYLTFAGESHGFRKSETIVAALEAELAFYGQILGFIPPGVKPVPLES